MLRNPRAHRLAGGGERPPSGTELAEPRTPGELADVVRRWAAEGVDRLVVEGGDGTVRELLGVLPEAFGARPVRVAVRPCGKTNALALDLGAQPGWSLAAALISPAVAVRAPLEVVRDGAASLRGFLLGAGVFVDAVRLAQRLHRARLVGGVSVGAALGVAGLRVLFGGADDPWRAGAPLTLEGEAAPGRRFLLLLSTLERLPLGLKPFGPVRPGMKLLDVAAPPRRLLRALPPVLSGRDEAWLETAGYRRSALDVVRMSAPDPFILDGELFDGGDLLVRRGAPVTFVVP